MLAQSGAQKILKDYDGAGSVTAVSFIIKTDNGCIPFRLPINIREVMQTINEQTEQWRKSRSGRERLVARKYYNDMEQARRVGWRIIKDWLEAQLALIFLRQVKLQEVFLPYIVGRDGKTLYETLAASNFKGLLLEDKMEERDG